MTRVGLAQWSQWRAPAVLLLCAWLAGCTTATTVQTVKVAVPVACQQTVPERPVMPTEALQPGVKLFDYVRASQAEIERREGYEGQLRTALVACTAPLAMQANQPEK